MQIGRTTRCNVLRLRRIYAESLLHWLDPSLMVLLLSSMLRRFDHNDILIILLQVTHYIQTFVH